MEGKTEGKYVGKIDYAYVHNQKCEILKYLGNFLKTDAPIDQIEVEVKRTLENIAFNEFEKLELKKTNKLKQD